MGERSEAKRGRPAPPTRTSLSRWSRSGPKLHRHFGERSSHRRLALDLDPARVLAGSRASRRDPHDVRVDRLRRSPAFAGAALDRLPRGALRPSWAAFATRFTPKLHRHRCN